MVTKSQDPIVMNMTPYVLLVGLGIHSLFEGIAVGMGQTLQKVSMMALAIVLHKGAVGLTLGTTFSKAFPSRDNHVAMLIFCFAVFTPIGVLIGWAFNKESPYSEVVFNCLAAGTFIYIACNEVLIEEFANKEHKKIKFLFYLIGIAFIASLKYVEPAEE